MSKFMTVLVIIPILFASGCLEKNEIKLELTCNADNINTICSASCQNKFNSTAETWRCSGDGHPVCICESYKDADKYVANP